MKCILEQQKESLYISKELLLWCKIQEVSKLQVVGIFCWGGFVDDMKSTSGYCFSL